MLTGVYIFFLTKIDIPRDMKTSKCHESYDFISNEHKSFKYNVATINSPNALISF